jgi:tyrosyl-tRNA synthetase
MESWEGAELNKAKEILARELTAMIHGEEEANKAEESARALFSQGNASDMPTVTLTDEDFIDEAIDILSLLAKSQLVPSKSEARRAVQQGGVTIDGEKITNIQEVFTKEAFVGEGLVIKKGKKNFKKVVMY